MFVKSQLVMSEKKGGGGVVFVSWRLCFTGTIIVLFNKLQGSVLYINV